MRTALLIEFGKRTLVVFIIGFILTLPYDFTLLPSTGNWLKPVIESFVNQILQQSDLTLYSDSLVMQIWVILLLAISPIIGLFWTLLRKKSFIYLDFWLNRIAIYYLSFILMVYGFNKVFLYQFYIPEPNTLFTPLGQLSPDILYWSSMGSSPGYSIFAGLLEVIPAFLLLYRKTRMIGATIALAVLVNVFFINWGFGITVKIFSSFLILLSLIVLFPFLARLKTAFFTSDILQPQKEIKSPQHPIFQKSKYIFHNFIIIVLLFEALIPYIRTGNFNGHQASKPYLYGAYSVLPNHNQVKRIFFHSDSYFILQTATDDFFDYPMHWNGSLLELTNYQNETTQLGFSAINDTAFQLEGNFYGTFVHWEMVKINLENLPFFQQ